MVALHRHEEGKAQRGKVPRITQPQVTRYRHPTPNPLYSPTRPRIKDLGTLGKLQGLRRVRWAVQKELLPRCRGSRAQKSPGVLSPGSCLC